MSSPHCTLFATTSGHSGVDRQFRHLAEYFAAAGLRVDVLRVRNHGPRVDAAPGIRSLELPAAHAWTSLFALVLYLRRERPAVLLSDKDKVNRVVLLARRLARVDTRVALRIGTTVSVNLQHRGTFERLVQRWSMRHLYRYAERVIVPSAGAAHDLAEVARLPLARISVLPNAVVREDLAERAREVVSPPWPEDPDAALLVTAGALIPRKDIPTLLRAVALLRERREVRLVVLGRGPEREVLERQAGALAIADAVHFAGFCANPYAWIARGDCYVQASRWEGFGIALVEALALGIPVVSTDCPSGPSEILRGGRYGALVPVGNARALAEAVARTLDNPPSARLLREAAAPYTVERSARAYMETLGLSSPDPEVLDDRA